MEAGVVAFAFGTPYSLLSNVKLADIASIKALEENAPIYTQKDIRLHTSALVEYVDQESDRPPSTLRIARGAVKWAQRNGLHILWVVAAEPHIWRALRDLKMAVLENGADIEIRVCQEEINRYTEDTWFCLDSTQERVRTRKAWNKRERIFKWMPFWLYKRIAN
jgi:hypothetical protein